MNRSPLCFSLFLLLLVTAGIPIAAASPTVKSILPATGPNDVAIAAEITGTGFNSGSIVTLTKCGTGSGTITGTISSVSATKITATFDLTGQAAGKWTVRVNTPYGEYPVDQGSLFSGFEVYKASGSSYTTMPTTEPTTTAVTTTTTSADGENSVFFETSPSGATIYLEDNEIGTSSFTYYTNREGTYNVVVKKIGYEDYDAKVVILEGKRVHFYAPLSLLSSTPSTTVTTKTSATPVKTTTVTPMTTTTAISTTINTPATTKTPSKTLPTPWGTDFPVTTKKSPSDPATALWAAVLGIAVVVMRRR
ncbi:MAG: PEGA domain-containing protein [Methanoregula sp.]|jgi:hypothetical protein